MDRHISAVKRNRQNEKRRLRNKSKRSFLRNRIRDINKAIETKDYDSIGLDFGPLKTVIDKAKTNGIIHKKAAARYKSRLSKRIRNLASSDNKLGEMKY